MAKAGHWAESLIMAQALDVVGVKRHALVQLEHASQQRAGAALLVAVGECGGAIGVVADVDLLVAQAGREQQPR